MSEKKVILDSHPTTTHAYGFSLDAIDSFTNSGTPHRKLTENGNMDAFLDFTVQALQKHHADPQKLQRIRKTIQSLGVDARESQQSPYPQADKTRKGNFAEVVLAEYIKACTTAQLPVYRLRYNPNVEQAMKGDDVLMFDLDSDPVRIIVGESKFRGTPSEQAVTDILDGLKKSHNAGLPISLAFVVDRLFESGQNDLAEKLNGFTSMYLENKLTIDYIGLLLSNRNASNHVNKHTTGELHNLLMISLSVNSPETLVSTAFDKLEAAL